MDNLNVRLFNLYRPEITILQVCYRNNENIKKRSHGPRIRKIEHGILTPSAPSLLVHQRYGLQDCSHTYKRLTALVAIKLDDLLYNNGLDQASSLLCASTMCSEKPDPQ